MTRVPSLCSSHNRSPQSPHMGNIFLVQRAEWQPVLAVWSQLCLTVNCGQTHFLLGVSICHVSNGLGRLELAGPGFLS